MPPRQLYDRYAPRLRALCGPGVRGLTCVVRVDDDDILQSVFRRLLRRRVGPGAYDVPAGEELWKLFLVLTLNKIRAKGIHHRAVKL